MKIFKISDRKILGIYLVVFGVLLFLKIAFYGSFELKYMFTSFCIFTGFELAFRSLRDNKKNIKIFFPGVVLFCISLFYLLYNTVLVRFGISFSDIWPILGFIPGLCLILYYLVYSKKSVSIIIPGIFITSISFVFMLSTLKILPKIFSKEMFLIILVPSIFILVGLYFIFNKQIEDIQQHIENEEKNSDKKD